MLADAYVCSLVAMVGCRGLSGRGRVDCSIFGQNFRSGLRLHRLNFLKSHFQRYQ
jgi:hypothetical protein